VSSFNEGVRLYLQCFTGMLGEGILEDLKAHYLYRESHIPGDPFSTAYREGQRSVVLHILQAMETAKDLERRGDGGA
jgi:hypothetical protein